MGSINKASDRRRSKWRNSDSNPTIALLLHRVGDKANGREHTPKPVIKLQQPFMYAVGERVRYVRNRWDMTPRYGAITRRDYDFDGVTPIYCVNGEWLTHRQMHKLAIVLVGVAA